MSLQQAATQRATTWRWTIAAASFCLFTAIALFGRVEVGHVTIGYPGSVKEPLQWVSLPFHADEAVDKFTASGTIWHSALSSGLLRIRPDDCVESLLVNGQFIAVEQIAPDGWLCWPHSPTIDLSALMRRGGNSITLHVTNASGGHGIDIIPVYSQTSLAAALLLLWLAMYQLARALSERLPDVRSLLTNGLPGRSVTVAFLPLLGPTLLAATMANHADNWQADHAVPTLLAFILPAVALLSCLDKLGESPLMLRRSFSFALTSVAAFAAASLLLDGQWTNTTINAIALAGAAAGFFATVPLGAFLRRAASAPRAVAVATVAALSPHAYWQFNLSLWGQMADLTGAMVRGVLWLAGITARTYPGDKKTEDGQITDYYVYVSSPEFSVQIGSWCSGFEGVSLFLFLLSLFVLLDWRLFSKTRHLWAAFLLTVPFILGVNALRIAGLFLYAVWIVREHGRTQAVWATIEAFHSNIGWVLYSLAFAVFLPLVYRWAKHAARTT